MSPHSHLNRWWSYQDFSVTSSTKAEVKIEINRQRTGSLNFELVVQMVNLLSRKQPNRCAKMTHRVLHQSQKEKSAIYASIYFGSIFRTKSAEICQSFKNATRPSQEKR